MGDGGRFPYPKEVWSPAGGWWAFPKAWRANTAVAFVVLAGLVIPTVVISERKMERYGEGNGHYMFWRPNLKSTVSEEE